MSIPRAPGTTGEALSRLAEPLRRWSLVSWIVGGVAAALMALAAGAWVLRAGIGQPVHVVLAAWLLVATAIGATAALLFHERRGLGAAPLARRLEVLGLGGGRRGALVGLLDPPAEGTSPDLVRSADRGLAEELAARGTSVLGGERGRLRRRAVVVLMLAGTGTALLSAARPARHGGQLLWQPGVALATLFAPVDLEVTPRDIERGGSVRVLAIARGHRSATLERRAPGEPWSSATILLSDGRLDTLIAGIEHDLFLRLRSGSRLSDPVRVSVRLPAFLGDLEITARFPEYLDLEGQVVMPDGRTIQLPAGTTLETRGVASVPLTGARWSGPGLATGEGSLAVEGAGFSGRVVPVMSGEYQLNLTTGDGRPLGGALPVLPIEVVPDSAPVVQILFPGRDTLLPADARVPLVIEARDDHGVSRAELLTRMPGSGVPHTEVLDLPAGTSAHLLLTHRLDLTAEAARLTPGDTIRYQVRAWDHRPGGQPGLSTEFALVVPTRAEEREAQRQAGAEIGSRIDSLAAQSRRLERETQDLAGQRTRGEAAGGGNEPRTMGFEEARRAEQLAADQEAMLEEAEALQDALEALRDAVQESGLQDSTLARRLAEIAEQMARALSPELRERLAQLQQALRALDPEAARQALERLAEAQRDLREAMERSRDLFQRAALEAELESLAQESRDLAEAQGEWNRDLATADSAAAAAREEALARAADSVAAGLDRAAGQMDMEQSGERLAGAAEQAREAARQMRQAARTASAGQRQQAREAGEAAQAAMDQVSQDTEAQREQQQDAWREEVVRALDRALAETARLSRQQLDLAGRFAAGATPATLRGTQALIEESAGKLLDQIRAIAGRNALVSPQIGVALAVARRGMAQAREAVSTGSPNPREGGERAGEAVDALNVAAFAMVRSRDNVAGASSGSGLAEAMEQMNQMAQQQGQLAQQSGGMLPMAGQAAMQMELQRLAARQQQLAQGMERLRAEGQVPGARDLAEEARELARRLESGLLDRETVARQEQLFRRMLDAGRTLQGEEEDERRERESRTAEGGDVRLPPSLRRVLEQEGRIRFPGWEAMEQLTPAERQLVTEYFRRLGAGTDRPGPP